MRLQERNSNEKALILFPALAFTVALAVIVGNRLSNEAIAVVVGAVCGISASIPVSVALVIAASRNWGRIEKMPEQYAPPRYPTQPPVIVISPPQQQPSPYSGYGNQFYLPPGAPEQGAPREFKIIGDE